METLSISSVTLPVVLVGQIIEEWLNANRFRVAHRVTGVDVIDAYDRETGVVHVDLALAGPAISDARAGKSVEETALALGNAHLVEMGTNGHGGSAKNGGARRRSRWRWRRNCRRRAGKGGRRSPRSSGSKSSSCTSTVSGPALLPGSSISVMQPSSMFSRPTAAEPPQTHKMPHCSACGVRAECLKSVIAGGDFARAECREAELL